MNRRKLEELNLLDNFLFGTMVTHPIYREPFCRLLLEIILQRDIKKLKVTGQNVIYGADTNLHGARLDVKIEEWEENPDEQPKAASAVYDLEPDLKEKDKAEIPRRTRFYHSLLDKHSLPSGTDYIRLPTAYVIMITDFDPFGFDRILYTVQNSCKEEPDMPYDDGMKTIFLNTRGTKGDIPETLKQLLHYMECTNHSNAVAPKLKQIDSMVEQVKCDTEVNTGYMRWMESKEELIQQGIEQQKVFTRQAEARAEVERKRAEKAEAELEYLRRKFEETLQTK